MAGEASWGQVDIRMEAANVAPFMRPWVEKLVAAWGVAWVSLLLVRAIWRLTPWALEPWSEDLMTTSQKGIYIAWLIANAYLEGYRGFQLRFSPRVVSRAAYLGQNPRPLWIILALPFCMSLFHSTRRQMTVSWVFIGALILLIWWVRSLPQPWRGIIDGGVVLGLAWGLLVIWGIFVRYLMGHKIPPPGDLPAENAGQEAAALG
ncbi:MAG: hypothetical protein JSV06_10910 [Myxococcales bacterium]|nr:MAG: hypothetical protein JSV06_10910 [Myxococcales bacterium]